jgi:hypothetical protein
MLLEAAVVLLLRGIRPLIQAVGVQSVAGNPANPLPRCKPTGLALPGKRKLRMRSVATMFSCELHAARHQKKRSQNKFGVCLGRLILQND